MIDKTMDELVAKRAERMGALVARINRMATTADDIVPIIGDTLYHQCQDSQLKLKVIDFEYDVITGATENGGEYTFPVNECWADPSRAWENYRDECLSEMRNITQQITSLKQKRTELGNRAINATTKSENCKRCDKWK